MRALCSHILLLVACCAVAGSPLRAQDAEAGKIKAKQCLTCHGKDGISRRPDAPNIAGQNDRYMRDQLRKYRAEERVHPVMNVVAKQLSDEDIDDLAAYYSGMKITVEIPE